MIWPARVWVPSGDGRWHSRPPTDHDDARRQGIAAEIQERRERRKVSQKPGLHCAAGAR